MFDSYGRNVDLDGSCGRLYFLEWGHERTTPPHTHTHTHTPPPKRKKERKKEIKKICPTVLT